MKLTAFKICLIILLSGLPSLYFGQQDTLSNKSLRQYKKQQKIEQGKLLVTPLAGPAYTPELGFTVAGSIMLSYKTNPKDSLIQRSSSPVSFGVSATGAVFFSSIISTFWLEDKLRVYGDIWYKDMPDNYWGVGYENAATVIKSDSTTAYKREWWWINPRILWQFRPHYFVGLNIDLNATIAAEPSLGVSQDPTFKQFGSANFNSGLGLIVQYDSRDIPVNAYSGLYVDLRSTFYSTALGGDNDYPLYWIDLRKYFEVDRKGRTLALQMKSRIGVGNMPYGEMSQLGTPFDLRGYTWGQYRDKSMLFFLGEYRHMFADVTGD